MGVSHKGAISLGLLYIPVGLYTTTRDNDVKFNQLCKDTKERVKYKKYCPSCNKEVRSEEIIKGYEYETNKYVMMTEDELEKIKTKKDKTIHIIQFVNLSEIDPIYYERNYYALPEAGAEKAFELLRTAMLQEQKVALAKTVIGTKENLIVLYPTLDGIIAKTLFYQDQIVAIPKQIAAPQLNDAEVTMAKSLINSMTSSYNASLYKDEYQERLRCKIWRSKKAGNHRLFTLPNNSTRQRECCLVKTRVSLCYSIHAQRQGITETACVQGLSRG